MIIDTSESKFDFSDVPKEHIDKLINTIDTKHASDEDLLAEANIFPRILGIIADQYVKINAEIENRNLLEPVPEILLDERTDDWLAERRADIRLAITALTKQQEALAAERDEIEQEFFRRFTERNTSGTRTAKYTISARQDDHYPEVQDRMEFEKYVLETGKLHLLQKRLSLTAIREELDALKEPREAYINILEEANWNIDTCRYVLVSLAEESGEDPINEEVIENKLAVFTAMNRVKESMIDALDQHYAIPGVGISTKLTLNQVKRG